MICHLRAQESQQALDPAVLLLAGACKEREIYMSRSCILRYPEGVYLKVLFSIPTLLQTIVVKDVDVQIYILHSTSRICRWPSARLEIRYHQS